MNEMIDNACNKNKKTEAEICIKIAEELKFVDIKEYSHNIVGLQLDILNDDYGEDALARVIRKNARMFTKKGWKHLVEKYKE